MGPLSMETDGSQQLSTDPLPFARSYQLEGLEKAMKQNTIVFLETGSGKTLIAIMLLRSYAYLLRKPSPFIAVFLVPQVVLVPQQAEAVELHTDLNVGKYWGDMGVDFWDAGTWRQEIGKHEVLVMTPAILLNGLRHNFFQLSMIKVLIIDECHHARGQHPYACIMTEFYHRQLSSGKSDRPRVLGMSASLIKSKGGNSEVTYWEMIQELETLMNSKVYTCVSESVLAEYLPSSTPKFLYYKHEEIPYALYAQISNELNILKQKHERALIAMDINESSKVSISKKISKIFSALTYCIEELGVWLAWKAAESITCTEDDFFSWGNLDLFGETVVKGFSMDAFRVFSHYIPSAPYWSIVDDVKANKDVGLATAKVVCLIENLLEYRSFKDIRCIVFVERVIAAVVLQALLSELLPKYSNWKTKYVAGNNSGLQSQTRKKQNEIVEEFRRGLVNVIVATSILEEGLDVQSCNLVIRFDPSSTVCSFIQSRGRARMRNSDYVLMVKSGDLATLSRLQKYLSSEDVMRKESLSHASLPCKPLENDWCNEEFYCVESTGAIVTLSSSVSLIYFYCSRLPSDGYFKPAPRWNEQTCILYLPKSCPIQTVHVQGNGKAMKQIVCLEACRKLHQIGALTDNLIPDIVVEEAASQEFGSKPYVDEHPCYVAPELVNYHPNNSSIMYHCYLIELNQNFNNEIPVHNIVLAMRSELQPDTGNICFDLDVDRGSLSVKFEYIGVIHLSPEQVLLCRSFQITLFRVLMDREWNSSKEISSLVSSGENHEMDYLLLPSTGIQKIIDWKTVTSVLSLQKGFDAHKNCFLTKGQVRGVQTKNGLVCPCRLQNSLVYTPHNDHAYFITETLDGMNGYSTLLLRDGQITTYKEYYKLRHGIELSFGQESLLNGRKMFKVQNYLQRCRQKKEKEPSNASVELPPELCYIVMSPISISTCYSYTFIPSIMHRLESLLVAFNLKRLHLDHCKQNDIPTVKVLEAITTKKCQEKFHLESLETLGDSFLKYAASQQLFKSHQNHHEGLLSVKKDRIVCNAFLCTLGCDRNLPGFIRTEPFDPKKWIVPGEKSVVKYILNEEVLSDTRKIHSRGRKKVKGKTVADVVEALIGAYLSTGGEMSALLFMNWIGIKVDLDIAPYERNFNVQVDKLMNVKSLESLLNYSFRDPSLLVEALTHGSYMLPDIPRCYQRLEFLGDAVLDYLITMYLYNKYPGMSPGLLTDLRSASVNNDCYARCAVKVELHKHILHTSHELHKHIVYTVKNFEKLSSESTFGWESETSFPKVLGDVIESLAGAIFVDSGDKEVVFRSMRPLLEPLITPETIRLHPARELTELCQKYHYDMKKPVKSIIDGVGSITIEVEANGIIYRESSSASDRKTAKKVACKKVLQALKESISSNGSLGEI